MLKLEAGNCIDIVEPYLRDVCRAGMPDVQLLGGVGSVALLHETTQIKFDEQRIVAPADLSLSNFRDDGNLRDVETLVVSSNKHDLEMVRDSAIRHIGNSLIIEVFGFQDGSKIDEVLAEPLSHKNLKIFLSDRYIIGTESETTDTPVTQRMLFPFSTPIDPEALKTWTIEIGDRFEIPVPSPGAIFLNYITRSISGIRAKDSQKVQKMGKSIFEKSPEFLDWIMDGPGKSQFDFARVLHTLRESRQNPRDLLIGDRLNLRALPYHDLPDHPSFMLSGRDLKTQRIALELAKLKARGLHMAESMPYAVTFFQKYIEPKISNIIHNN